MLFLGNQKDVAHNVRFLRGPGCVMCPWRMRSLRSSQMRRFSASVRGFESAREQPPAGAPPAPMQTAAGLRDRYGAECRFVSSCTKRSSARCVQCTRSTSSHIRTLPHDLMTFTTSGNKKYTRDIPTQRVTTIPQPTVQYSKYELQYSHSLGTVFQLEA